MRLYRRLLGILKAGVHAVIAWVQAPLYQKEILQGTYLLQLMQLPRYQDSKRLMRYENQVFSQHGQDGIIDEIFRRIGTKSKTFVEIGCGNGLENNTTNLLRSGWSGFWFDGSKERIASVPDQFETQINQGILRTRQAFFDVENAVHLLESSGVPKEFDLLSLDIDRNTYYVWKALVTFRPRVVIIEYNSKVLASCDWKVDYDPKKSWNSTSYMGASLKALEKLGHELDYELVGCETRGVDAFFVRKDQDLSSFASPFTAENHYEPPRYFLLSNQGHPSCFKD